MMKLNWVLIVGLASLGLIRHLLYALNILDMSGGVSSTMMTFIISLVWGMVARRNPYPFRTLVAVGLVHGIFVLLLSLVLPIIPTGPEGFVPVFAWMGVLVVNLLWGAILGATVYAVRPAQNHEPSVYR